MEEILIKIKNEIRKKEENIQDADMSLNKVVSIN